MLGDAVRVSNTRSSGSARRAFRIYDGPTEVHKWSLAKKIKREWRDSMAEDGNV